MKKLFSAILLSILGSTAVIAAGVEFSRTSEEEQFIPGSRRRAAERTFFFPEFQFMYGTFQNYLHKWIDRPLFFDRSTRYPDGTFSYITESSFRREAELVRAYGFDGIGSLSNIAAASLYRDTDQFVRRLNDKRLLEFAQYGFYLDGYDVFKTVLEIAEASPFTARVNGKILVPTYNVFLSNRQAVVPMIERARKELGETFLILGQLDCDVADVEAYRRTGRISEEVRAKYRNDIELLLRTYDGIQINPAVNITDQEGEYMCKFDTTFYTDFVLPMIEELLASEQFQGKLLGNTVLHGYVNHMSGVNHGEFGTARLRASLDAAIRGNPDYILFFEWNEVNENTCFQPTLYNSMALQRLIRYAIGHSRGEKPLPNPGDDLTLPNLILSCRETLKIGEPLQFELLNIPDTIKEEVFQAQLELRDADGKTIQRFPVENFRRDRFNAVTFTVASEDLAQYQLLRPVLTITSGDGKERLIDGFQYIHLRPTVCNVYKSVRQPIRDLLIPREVQFSATPGKDGRIELAAKLAADEELASLEILDNEREVAAFDRADEFGKGKNRLFVGSFSNQRGALFPVSFRVDGSANWQFRPWHAPNVNFAFDIKRHGDEASGNALIWAQPCNFIISIPEDEVDRSVLRVSANGKSCAFDIPELLKYGKMAAIVDPDRAIRLDMESFEKLPDIPVSIDAPSAEFTASVKSDFRFPVYQLRAVTKTGKIYRSAPIRPILPSGRVVDYNFFSETRRQVASAKVIADLVPVLNYQFDSARGAMLDSGSDARFDAQLGGGFVYCEPFSADMLLPVGKTNAPEWRQEHGRDYLYFNGDYQYINFPGEAFPRGSFELDFEIRPSESERPLILFRHFDPWLGSVSIYLKYNRLYFAFGDRLLKTHKFATNLAVPAGKWSHVTIAYDCQKIRFEVDGRSRTFPLSARALYFKPAIFGGHDKIEFGIDEPMSYYKGDLRSFIIRHIPTR